MNISDPIKKKELHTNTSVLAYIDDSLWIAQDQNSLQNILETANTFYNLHNIKVNPTKSLLITNLKNTNSTIIFNREEIPIVQPILLFKYLSI